MEMGVEWGYNPTSLQKDVEVLFSVGLVQKCWGAQGGGKGRQQIRSMLRKEQSLVSSWHDQLRQTHKIMSILQKSQPTSSLALS